ncbi:KEOPS complex subunit Pcc1 [Methanothrix sp.]|uniref:KEOPS complex subunit Pcc1 n=1 Tax=Methanothrix sp. TaxID=90426 RepID=UPI002B5B83C9|nr:KEOPS complex subunit Pcc1 [Methanothrix sp.]HOK58784.1 KEOPS complex subunit Pcc1 [Methanothrix sp.]HOL43975.1 KEOPS complex subunit Pcc1 [Methanothrix sp.]HPO89012.1 KEOPS complex subunit Pcc1 [Methanothrix sp.]
MISVKLIFWGSDVQEISKALEPDNLPSMKVSVQEDELIVELSAERIGTVLSTVDDLLMNIKVAEEAIGSSEV